MTALAAASPLYVSHLEGRAPAQPRIVAIRVIDRDANGAAPVAGLRVDVEALAARMAERLRKAPVWPLALADEGRAGVDYRLVVEVRLRDSIVDGETVLGAFVGARLNRVSESASDHPHAIVNEAVAERVLSGTEALDAVTARAHLERAADDVLDGLLRLARLWSGPLSERLAAISGDDAELRSEAVHAVAERKETEAVPTLVAILKDERAERRDLALGALLEIGDQRAVKPITEMARLGDTEALPRIIDAMVVLGGAEARAYLEFVVSAHDDEQLRSQASAALVRLGQHPGGTTFVPKVRERGGPAHRR